MRIFLFTLTSIAYLAIGQDECLPTRCEPLGPVIRFPFRLKDHQPEHCGHPGFDLSCSKSGRTELDFQFPLTASTSNINLPLQMTAIIWNIDYEAQKMLAGNARTRSCLPDKLPTLNSSASSFEVEALGYGDGYTLFNCSNTRNYDKIPCLSSHRYQVIPFPSVYEITSLPPYSSCFKMYNLSYVPDGALAGRGVEYGTHFYLRWNRPFCRSCEAKGKQCRLRNGGTNEEIECFTSEQTQHGSSRKHKLLITGMIGGTILVAFIMVASFFIIRAMKRKKDEQKRVEKALEKHKDMRPRRYSYSDIKKSTNNFKQKVGQGSYLHKGMLSDGTSVAVKMLLNGSKKNVEDFISEVEKIGQMQNTNILQLIGFCVDGDKRGLIYELSQSGNLETLENQSHTLGWEKLHQIALSIAKAVDYVHKECTQRNLNLDINPQSILLDQNSDPRILVFTQIAPEQASSSLDIISQKADVYSFGMSWLDIVGRRRNLHKGEKESCEVEFPEWFYNEVENREEGAIQIEEENEIAKKLSIVGLWCIQWFPSDRPSMKAVIGMLEGDNMPAMPPNPFASFELNTQK